MEGKDKKGLELNKELTGHFAVDIGEENPQAVNAEIENKEWMMYPDGSIQKGHGEKHTKGGIEVSIPDGTKIISDAIEVGAKTAKTISKKFDINVKAKDTFATVIEKYSKKIGLNKAVKEQADYFDELKKQEGKKIDEKTSLINNEFLSGKINELEAKKNELNGQLIGIFNDVFDKQEVKKDANPEKYENEPDEMEYGGVTHRDLKIVADRMGISLDQAIEIATGKKKKKNYIFNLGGVKKYEDAGIAKEDKPKKGDDFNEKKTWLVDKYTKGSLTKNEYEKEMIALARDNGRTYSANLDSALNTRLRDTKLLLDKVKNQYAETQGISGDNVKKQHAEGLAYGEPGKSGTIEGAFQEVKSQFPAVYREYFKGKTPAEVAKDFDNKKAESIELVKGLQKAINKDMKETAEYVKKNADKFSKENVDFAEQYLKNETFMEADGDVRSLDGKLGEFTATRRGLGVDVVRPDEQEILKENDIYTVRDLANKPDVLAKLSEETQDRVKAFGADAPNFKIMEYTPAEPAPAETPKEKKPDDEIVGKKPDNLNRRSASTFYPYRASASFPLQPQLGQEVSLNRIDPERLRYEEDHQAMREGMRANSRSGMTPQQRLAANAALISQQQRADVEGQVKAATATAQNYSQANTYNAQIGDREQVVNKQFASKYFDDMANSVNAKRLNDEERDLNMHRQALKHYDQNRMNSIYQELFDYNPGYFNSLQYDRNGNWGVVDKQNRMAVGISADGQPAPTETKKAAKK